MEEITYSMIRFQDVPMWWSIGWFESLPGFTLKIKNEVLEKFQEKITFRNLKIRAYQANNFYNKVPLSLNPNENWGFNNILELDGKDDVFSYYVIKFPEEEEHNQTVFYILATLDILTTFFTIVEIPKSESDEPQLLNVSLSVESFRCSLMPMLSKALIDWFYSFEFSNKYEYLSIDEVEQVMRDALVRIYPKDAHRSSLKVETQCRIKKGGLITLQLPGVGCGLGPGKFTGQKEGYDLLPHNIEYSGQALVFLVGMARLCSLWRENKF